MVNIQKLDLSAEYELLQERKKEKHTFSLLYIRLFVPLQKPCKV